jgi:hypothetical protein
MGHPKLYMGHPKLYMGHPKLYMGHPKLDTFRRSALAARTPALLPFS